MARLLLLTLALLFLSGCAQQRDPNTVVLWTAFETEIQTLRDLTAKFEQQTGRHVEVLQVPFSGLQNKFMVAAPAGQGPDLIIGPQDWLGVFATAELLEPVPAELLDPARADLSPVALANETFNGKVYGFPMMLGSLAMLRNTKLMPERPKNLDELKTMAVQIQGQGSDVKGFYYDLQDFYFSFPFFAAYGASLFEEGPDGPDPMRLGLATPGGVKAAEYLTELRQADLIPLGAKTDFAKSMFLAGRLAATINGPWFIGDVRREGIPYAIESVPPAPDGHPASSLVGVDGLMLNKAALQREGALQLMAFLTAKEQLVALALSSGRPPARQTALEEARQDPQAGADIAAFARVSEQGVPMPNLPQTNVIWEPMAQALAIITNKQAPAQAELEQTQARIVTKIKLMME